MGMSIRSYFHTAGTLADIGRLDRARAVRAQRLSSGYRINSAGDDPAGFAISGKLGALIQSAGQATRNTNDGISVVNTADSASQSVSDLLKRVREIAVQASSATLSSADRTNLTNEMSGLITEVGRVAANTEFNSINLTDGSTGTLSVQVGLNGTSDDRISITLGDLQTSTLGVDSLSISTTTTAAAAISTIDTALDSVNAYRAKYGATTNRFESAVDYMSSYSANLIVTQSNLRDADFAYETAEHSKLLTMQQAAIAVLAQQIRQPEYLLALL
jgi:flagellin